MASWWQGQFSVPWWSLCTEMQFYLLLPWLMRNGTGFWPALAVSCALTVVLYLVTAALLARFGIRI